MDSLQFLCLNVPVHREIRFLLQVAYCTSDLHCFPGLGVGVSYLTRDIFAPLGTDLQSLLIILLPFLLDFACAVPNANATKTNNKRIFLQLLMSLLYLVN